MNAMPRNIVVRTVPADSGWRAIAVMALPTIETDADAGSDRGAAVDDAAADSGQALLELSRVLRRENEMK